MGQHTETVCRIKLNQEVWNKLNFPDIVMLIKVCGLEWLGHVRMVGEGTGKNLPEGKPGGQRKEEDLDYGGCKKWASVMRPRPNLKCCSVKEEEDGNLWDVSMVLWIMN